MVIPEKVKILGQTYNVIWDSDISVNHDSCGFARHSMQEIILAPSCKGDPRHQENIEETFIHEILHGIFVAIGRGDINRNDLIDPLSRAIYAVLKDNGWLK